MTILSKGGNYLKAEDAKKGEIVTFKDEGAWEESSKYKYDDGNPVKSYVMTVTYEGQEKKLKINKASRVALIDAFGNDTKKWIGRQASIFVMPTANGQNKTIILDPIMNLGEVESVRTEKWEP